MTSGRPYFGDFTMAAFWAVVAGVAASFMAERGELHEYWRKGKEERGASA